MVELRDVRQNVRDYDSTLATVHRQHSEDQQSGRRRFGNGSIRSRARAAADGWAEVGAPHALVPGIDLVVGSDAGNPASAAQQLGGATGFKFIYRINFSWLVAVLVQS
jgi:hypothetical protein